MLTHWDPGMYPDEPVPLIQELVINILVHGHIALKEVDLFMNERIVSYLSGRHRNVAGISNWDLFASLIRTRRIIILTPDPSRGLDPNAPIYAAAEDHAQLRGHAGLPWTSFDDERKAFCRKLDELCVGAGVCRPRETPPSDQNAFAELLHDILMDEDQEWLKRKQFCHITTENTKVIAEFCREPSKAIRFLERKTRHDIINPEQGFYRTRLYQCAETLDNALERWSFENLAQTVYFTNEMDRERCSGSYFGRLAECPNPYLKQPGPGNINIGVVPTVQKGVIPLIASPDLGDVINETLATTGSTMRGFWNVAAASTDPEKEFSTAWACIIEEFAKANSRHASIRQRLVTHSRWEGITSFVHCLLLRSELGVMVLRCWLHNDPHEVLQPILEGVEQVIPALVVAANGIQLVGENTESWIRSGLAEARMLPKTRNALLGAAAIRSSVVPAPVKPSKKNREESDS